MSDTELSHLRSLNWDDIGLRLLVFAKYWARTYYFWREGQSLPEGKIPEDIAKEAISAFWAGIRQWNPKYDVFVQLKNAVRSILSNLHKKKSSQVTAAQPPEILELHIDDKPDPASEVISEDYCKSIFEALYEHDKVLNSEELLMIVMAYEDGAESVDEVAQKTGLTQQRIYELRRQLKEMKQSVLDTLNKEKTK